MTCGRVTLRNYSMRPIPLKIMKSRNALVTAPRVRVGEIGEPLDSRRHVTEPLKDFVGKRMPWRGDNNLCDMFFRLRHAITRTSNWEIGQAGSLKS